MPIIKQNSAYLISILFIFLADQISKWWIIERFFTQTETGFWEWLLSASHERLPFMSHEVLPFFNLVMVWNKGVSFGLFASNADMTAYILSGLAFVIAVCFFIYLLKSSVFIVKAACTLIVAGAIGNIMDRLRFGAVADFLDFHVMGWHYPAFNIADSCIVLGVGLYLFVSFFTKDSKE